MTAGLDSCEIHIAELPKGPCEGVFQLIFQPILKPAVNDWRLVASRTEIEKVRLFCL